MPTYNLTAVVTLNSIPVRASFDADSLEEAVERFENELHAGEHNGMIRDNTGLHFEVDQIEED